MKNFQRFYSVFFIVILALVINGCSQNDQKYLLENRVPKYNEDSSVVTVPKDEILISGKTRYVVLLVDSETINSNSEPKNFCKFPDLKPKELIQDYTTNVRKGDTVVWLGISTSAPNEDIIEITGIKHREGDNVVEPNQREKGKVAGLIKGKKGDKEAYAIIFSVTKKGMDPDTFELDPKLLVH